MERTCSVRRSWLTLLMSTITAVNTCSSIWAAWPSCMVTRSDRLEVRAPYLLCSVGCDVYRTLLDHIVTMCCSCDLPSSEAFATTGPLQETQCVWHHKTRWNATLGPHTGWHCCKSCHFHSCCTRLLELHLYSVLVVMTCVVTDAIQPSSRPLGNSCIIVMWSGLPFLFCGHLSVCGVSVAVDRGPCTGSREGPVQLGLFHHWSQNKDALHRGLHRERCQTQVFRWWRPAPVIRHAVLGYSTFLEVTNMMRQLLQDEALPCLLVPCCSLPAHCISGLWWFRWGSCQSWLDPSSSTAVD